MTSSSALQPVPLDADRVRLRNLEEQVEQREHDLDRLKVELGGLQSKYLNEIGALYSELSVLEAAVAEAEIRAGLRQPPEVDDSDPDETATDEGGPSCSNRSAPSDDLRRVFRDVAKAIHPDLALDEPARCRRHSLMAEANRAYAERDEDRLRLILRAWERGPEAILDDNPDVERARVARRLSDLDERLVAIEAEFADLRNSAIHRLKVRIDEARSQGWDLFAEMILQVRREISRASLRLASLHRSAADSTIG